MSREKKPYCLKKKNGIYYYKLPHMENYKTTGLTSKGKAEKMVLELIEENKKNEGLLTITNKTFGEYTKDYFILGKCPYVNRRSREGKELTQRYVSECYRILDTRIRKVSWFCRKKMNDIRRKDIIHLIDDLSKDYTNGVVNDCLDVLSKIFNESLYNEDIDRNPMTGIHKLKENRKEKVPFSLEDIRRMFPVDDEEEIIRLYGSFSKFICEFIEFNTGMRNGEVRCLKWKNIDLSNNTIDVRESFKDNSTEITGTPKNGKSRLTGMCDKLKEMLILYRDRYSNHTEPDDYVCCWEDGRPFRYETTRDTHERVLNQLGIDKRGQHTLRHTFNSNLRGRNLVSDLDIRTTTGWKDENIQDNYTHTEVISSQNMRNGQNKIWEELERKIS